ncbi:hypothetical protein A0H81_02975 [Grifola frondosa]|uniref:Uncharacterized protein n=1 Tax=Grifola frondosa TaxID=5627 RepID=A0A1C7MHA9_GRIFR|nr:hypothetical protein A0H81_02975 [Grifola frondosa]
MPHPKVLHVPVELPLQLLPSSTYTAPDYNWVSVGSKFEHADLAPPGPDDTWFLCDATEPDLSTSTMRFCRAKLYKGNPYSNSKLEAIDVMVKGMNSDFELLAKEAEAYEHLKDLQGRFVPRFYGHFYGRPRLNDDNGELSPRPAVAKIRFIRALYALHRAGLDHGAADFETIIADFVINDYGFPFLTNLGTTQSHCDGPCQANLKLLSEFEAPDRDDFGCTALYIFAKQLNIWHDDLVDFFGLVQKDTLFLNIDDVVDTVDLSKHPEETKETIRQEAERTQADVLKRWEENKKDRLLLKEQDWDSTEL